MPCAQVVQRSKILPSLVQLLVQGQEALTACGDVVTPKWLAPLLLLIDLLEKVAMCTQRRDKMYKVRGLKIFYTGSICYLYIYVCEDIVILYRKYYYRLYNAAGRSPSVTLWGPVTPILNKVVLIQAEIGTAADVSVILSC